MIQILIAEDEALARIGIRYCLDTDNSHYELVGEAENGKQALEMCLRLKPQILITDIKMPVMDGIELIRQIKARNLDIKIIILTCYEEFKYLHEAMHLGIDDYLLKVALKPERLLEVLEKVRKKYWDNVDQVSSVNESKLEVLESIMMGYLDEHDEIEHLIKQYHLNLDFSRYGLLLVDTAQGEISRSYYRDTMLSRSIRATLADCINLEAHGEVAQCGQGRFVAFVYPDGDTSQAEALSILENTARRMMQVSLQSLNVQLAIGISNLHSGISELNVALAETEHALDHIFFQNDTFIYRACDDGHDEKSISSEILRLDLKHLHEAIYANDAHTIRATTSHFCDLIKTGNLHESEARSWFVRAYTTAVSSFEDKTNTDFDVRQKMQSLKKMMFRTNSLQEISCEIERLIGEITAQLNDNPPVQTNALIYQITTYADEHFEENLTLDYISHKFGISVTYFCKIFKRIMGMTFVEYLTDRRIKEAMRLIRHTDLPNYAIAQRIGFQNPEYFSKTFKKLTGITPKEYKRSADTNPEGAQKR